MRINDMTDLFEEGYIGPLSEGEAEELGLTSDPLPGEPMPEGIEENG